MRKGFYRTYYIEKLKEYQNLINLEREKKLLELANKVKGITSRWVDGKGDCEKEIEGYELRMD
jgi:hypothetical protein